jgi:thioredoxin-like negative regulator of GroEL
VSDEVIARWKAQVAKFPTSELPRFSLAKAYLDAEAYEEAAGALREAVVMKPDWMAAKIMLARTLITLEQYDEARPVLQESRMLAHQQGHASPIEEINELIDQLPEG